MNTVCKALAVMAFLAGSVAAETITFKNELRGSVVVQTATVYRGKVNRDKPQLLAAGETSTGIPLDGDKLVIIYDGRSNRELCKTAVKAGRVPYYFLIVQDRRTGKFGIVQAKRPTSP
ncbi:MAG: hypothetical protein K2W96_15515 [Gemmataceae bacterium]|nr:hypothetical protein [Gemmataceae bacterium]